MIMRCTLLFTAALLFIGSTLCEGARYDAAFNSKRIKEITLFTLEQVKKQEKEYLDAVNKSEKKEGNNNSNSSAPGNAPAAPESIEIDPNAPKPPPPTFKLDLVKLKAAVTKRFGGKLEDSLGPNPKVDIRSELDIREAVAKEVQAKFPRTYDELLAEEHKKAEELYPLYQPGQRVEISYAIGNEPRRTYRGIFRRTSRFRIQIAQNYINLNDLPESIRARFDAEWNKKLRQKYIDAHPIISKYQIAQSEEIQRLYKECLAQQMDKNLRRGWIMINNAWRMPQDMVEEILEYRKKVHKGEFIEGPLDRSWAQPGNY